jgi:hypothetical protein
MMALAPGGLCGAKTSGRAGDGGTFNRGVDSVRKESNVKETCTRSLRNGFPSRKSGQESF